MDIFKKEGNKADVFKPSAKFWGDEMRELWIFGGHEPDLKESGYCKEDIQK